MKQTFYLIAIIFFPTIICYAQHGGIIYTPKGDSIEYYNQPLGDTAFFRVAAESLINSNGWDATMVAPANGKYNCHAFCMVHIRRRS